MSLVVFPFKQETLSVVAANLTTAVTHDRVTEVWAVGTADDVTTDHVATVAQEIGATYSKPVSVFPQERIGTYRPGKGDGMNTALRKAAERGFERVHFYDADITNFDQGWIDGAESGADRGFGVVRHRFPRAATDAMITWMVTRPGLALLFPNTILPRLGQPLGGELLLGADAVVGLAEDSAVSQRSDWGIDTLITHRTSTMGLDIYEHNAPDGKRHALYGSLTEIRDMVLECLDAVSSLRESSQPASRFEADPPAPVPPDLKTVVGYDIESTEKLLETSTSIEEEAVLEHLGAAASSTVDAEDWLRLFPLLLSDFRLDDRGWRAAVFRLWVMRVLTYTRDVVPLGYDEAMRHLDETVRRFETVADEYGTS